MGKEVAELAKEKWMSELVTGARSCRVSNGERDSRVSDGGKG